MTGFIPFNKQRRVFIAGARLVFPNSCHPFPNLYAGDDGTHKCLPGMEQTYVQAPFYYRCHQEPSLLNAEHAVVPSCDAREQAHVWSGAALRKSGGAHQVQPAVLRPRSRNTKTVHRLMVPKGIDDQLRRGGPLTNE